MSLRIHATKLKTGEQVFGSLNIGELSETGLKTFKNEPVYKNESGEIFYCSEKMKERINERIKILQKK